MIRILIVGDSFGEISSFNSIRFPDVGPGWPELLAQHTNFQVTNLCQGGSSLYFSYKNFKLHYKQHDKIIFCLTKPGRRYLPIPNYDDAFSQHHHNVESVNRLKLRFQYDPIASKYVEALEDYYTYLQDIEYDKYAQYTLVDHVQRLRPDTILIPCFQDSFRTISGHPMEQIGFNELKYLFNWKNFDHNIFNDFYKKGLTEARKCHMCEENNFIFYQDVLRWLDGDPVYINVNKFVAPSKPVSHYWRKDQW